VALGPRDVEDVLTVLVREQIQLPVHADSGNVAQEGPVTQEGRSGRDLGCPELHASSA
jgi:hypothetical protein